MPFLAPSAQSVAFGAFFDCFQARPEVDVSPGLTRSRTSEIPQRIGLHFFFASAILPSGNLVEVRPRQLRSEETRFPGNDITSGRRALLIGGSTILHNGNLLSFRGAFIDAIHLPQRRAASNGSATHIRPANLQVKKNETFPILKLEFVGAGFSVFDDEAGAG